VLAIKGGEESDGVARSGGLRYILHCFTLCLLGWSGWQGVRFPGLGSLPYFLSML
jgi:hypothetical protein